MKNYLFILLAIATLHANAQIKKPVKKTIKKTSAIKKSKPEIDRLYEKYKNSDYITLYTPHGDLEGEVFIETNDLDKPISINISGVSGNKSAISEFISNTIKMKERQGYTISKTSFEPYESNYIELVELGLGWTFREENSFQMLMKKGNMYFKVNAGCCATNEEGVSVEGYSWEIETGDSSRKGGKNATTFEF